MKHFNLFVCSAALLYLAGSCLAAEETKQTAPLSLGDCIRIAMHDQTDVVVARNNVTVARTRVSQAVSTYFPQLSIQNNAFTWGTQGVLNQVTTGTAFSVSQNIFDGGLREVGAQGARYGVKQNTASLSRTTQTVTYSVTTAYYNVLRSKHLAETAESSVKYTEELRKQVEARATAGAAAAVDVLPVEAQLANARVSLLSAQNAVRTSALALQSAMGVTPTSGFDIQDVGSVTPADTLALEKYVSDALAARPDVTEVQASYGAARASTRAARLNLFPRPVISGQYQQRIQGGFTSTGTQVVGGIVFDLFNGGANLAALREAKANQASAAQQIAQIGRDIQVQVEEGYLNLTSAKERLAASEIGLTAAKRNYDAQVGRYNQGVAIPLDLLNAELQVATAQTNEIQARYDYYTAIAQLEYATGKQGGHNAG